MLLLFSPSRLLNFSDIDVQKKAQAELDQVIGSDRLPSFSDRDNLPYIHAVVLEILRWHNVAPLGKLKRTPLSQRFF